MRTIINILVFTFLVFQLPFYNTAEASLSIKFGKHGPRGNRYCLLDGGICWHSMETGDPVLSEDGRIDAFVINSSQIHFVFYHDMLISALPDSLLPVDTTTLNTAVSNYLGYHSISLVPGNYHVDFSHYEFGEATIDAVLGEPLTTLNLTCSVEGLYDPAVNSMTADTIKVNLRSITPPFSIVDNGKVQLNSAGNGQIYFTNAFTGAYYIQVIHRNSIDTWSKPNGELFTYNGTTAYNFTTSQTKAYGSNMTLKGSKWCVYSGDENKDGFVNGVDLIQIYNDASVFVTGYVNTDLTGNNAVDLSDVIIAYNNSSNFVHTVSP